MAIKVENLTKIYAAQKALNAVSFDLGEDCILGLLGPNGAGKSTLMKSLVGLVLPTEGSVSIDGLVVSENQVQIARKIGYLPENNPLYYEMYVREYLTFVANIRNLSPQKVYDVVERVGLTPEQNKKIGQLSKGYKQRVGLAQAIIHEPEILILDEPTNGLDPNQILEIRELIKQVGQGKTVIVSTHIMQEVEALCDRILVLNKGQKAADCTLSEFKQNYQSLEEAFYQKTK